MKYWFTIHAPHGDRDLPWHIYLQEKYKDISKEIKINDKVFFYETKTEKNKLYKFTNGRMGLVHIGTVTGEPYHRNAKTTYTSGETKDWGTGIPTNAEDSEGLVSREKVVDILGYKSNYYFKGFNGGRGIKQIEVEQAQQLENLFNHGTKDYNPISIAEEIQNPEIYIEGATKEIYINIYERDIKARNKCIEHYGCSCVVCNFNFSDKYGEVGNNFIHVHHLIQLSDIGKEYKVDPIKDLRPVCPNCHAMIHRTKNPLSIENLKKLIEKC